jgi:hypothetical protein
MKEDKDLLHHKPEIVEKLGKEKYGLPGASLLITNPGAYDQQMKREDPEYSRGLRNFKEQLAEYGLLYNEDKDEVSKGLQYEFDDVKAYDLHHMTYDFTYDFKIASINVDNFVKIANERYDAYEKALDYLKRSGQEGAFDSIINSEDILSAKRLADEFRKTGNVYHSKFEGIELARHNPATMRLDNDIYSELSNKNVMKSLQEIIQDMEKQHDDSISIDDDNYLELGRGHKKI